MLVHIALVGLFLSYSQYMCALQDYQLQDNTAFKAWYSSVLSLGCKEAVHPQELSQAA